MTVLNKHLEKDEREKDSRRGLSYVSMYTQCTSTGFLQQDLQCSCKFSRFKI